MRIRFAHLAAALAAALAVMALAAVVAGATYYKSSRPALKIDFRTKHHRITRIGFAIKVRCERRSDGTPTGPAIIASGFDQPIPFDRTTGRFTARKFSQGGESGFLTVIKGFVQRDKVSGYIREDADIQAPSQRCQSGTPADPWVHFVARRGSGPRPFAQDVVR